MEPFLKRMAGLVKYALNSKQGWVNLTALAAASAQSERAVRAGLAWMHSRGHITILSQAGDGWLIGEADGEEKPDATERLTQMKETLAETAAFRAYYQRADAEGLTSLAA
jgi:MarR-like DNA-binding transcriptional regulator SgrR of sgrS sRNA